MNVTECLDGMMKADPTLYRRILGTPGFAFWFNQLALLAGTPPPAPEKSIVKPRPGKKAKR